MKHAWDGLGGRNRVARLTHRGIVFSFEERDHAKDGRRASGIGLR